MPADPLLDMARRACSRYSARISDIGDLEYDLIRPILLKIESPEKLHQLEQTSPQIIGKDAEIWLSFIKRDIPDWHLKRHEPRDPKNWWKVYRKLKEEARMDSTADEAMLKAALANIKNEKEQNTAQIASSRIDVPYLAPSRKSQMLYNYASGKAGSKGANKMTLMEKIRKEAHSAKASKMNRPMHELQKRATTVTKAPQQFVEELRQKAAKAVSPPPRASPSVRTPRPPLHAPRPKQPAIDSSYDLTKDREGRLRALKNGGLGSNHHGSAPTSSARNMSSAQREAVNATLTTDFLEDSDDDETQPHRKLLEVEDNRPRSASPMRMHPQQHTLKRKQPPSLFTSSPKRSAKPASVS